jgi:hypothetical protein
VGSRGYREVVVVGVTKDNRPVRDLSKRSSACRPLCRGGQALCREGQAAHLLLARPQLRRGIPLAPQFSVVLVQVSRLALPDPSGRFRGLG